MTSNKEAQAARSAADRVLRDENQERYTELMQAEYDKRGLGEYKRKTTAEERAERKEAAEKAKAAAKIREWADKGGIDLAVLAQEAAATTRMSQEGDGTFQVDGPVEVPNLPAEEDEPEWARG